MGVSRDLGSGEFAAVVGGGTMGQSKHILVVDDNGDVREVIVCLLYTSPSLSRAGPRVGRLQRSAQPEAAFSALATDDA